MQFTTTCVFLAAAMFGACAGETPRPQAHEAEMPPSASTRWQRVEPASRSGWLDAPAKVVSSPNDTALVVAPLQARVVRVRARVGQTVDVGAPLVDVLMPELIRAAGALRAADLQLESWQDRRALLLPLVEKRLARAADLSDIDANIAKLRGDRENARATLRAAGEADQRARGLLDGDGVVSLRAPIHGVVVHVNAKLGETRDPASGPLVELVNADVDTTVEARFAVAPPPGASFEWLDTNLRVQLVLASLSPHADEHDGSLSGWLHVKGGAAPLVAGSLGRVRMVQPADWVIVPASAVREQDGASVVMVKTEGGMVATRVDLIQRGRGEALVQGLGPDVEVAADVHALAESPL